MSRIAVSQIRENPVALRAVNKESESYLGLVDSIRQVGVLNPIVVRPSKDEGFYDLIDGLHRFTAARDANLSEIPANVISANEADILNAQIITNIHKVETKPIEYTRQLVRILAQNPLLTAAELAYKLAKSPTWVSERLNLLRLAEPIQNLVNEGKIVLANAYPLAKLPLNEQTNYIDQACTMNTTEFTPLIQARAKEIAAAARQGKAPEAAVFKPVEFLQKVLAIKEARSNPAPVMAALEAAKAKSPMEIVVTTLNWVLNVDPISAKQQMDKHEERKAKLKAAADERKAKRDEQKAKEAAEAQVAVTV